jgi:hypothetical protein
MRRRQRAGFARPPVLEPQRIGLLQRHAEVEGERIERVDDLHAAEVLERLLREARLHACQHRQLGRLHAGAEHDRLVDERPAAWPVIAQRLPHVSL